MRSMVRVMLVAACLMPVAALPASVASGTSPDRVRPPKPDVFVVGDSLTVGSSPYIRAGLRRGFGNVTVDARVGRMTAEGLALLSHGRSAELWVVALGTNDGPLPWIMRQHVRAAVRNAKSRPVLWVSIWRSPAYQAVNHMLSREARRSPHLNVLRWDRYLGSHRYLLAADGVHLSATGYEVLGGRIAERVRKIAAAHGLTRSAPRR